MKVTQIEMDAFQKVKKALLKQKEKSWRYHMCVYRGPNGTKCAVGFLLPDAEYNMEFEMLTLEEVRAGSETLKRYSLDFLTAIQRIHDKSPVDNWPEKFEAMEKELELA
jgi:hypothetical protein